MLICVLKILEQLKSLWQTLEHEEVLDDGCTHVICEFGELIEVPFLCAFCGEGTEQVPPRDGECCPHCKPVRKYRKM